jgi:hypothetical protein
MRTLGTAYSSSPTLLQSFNWTELAIDSHRILLLILLVDAIVWDSLSPLASKGSPMAFGVWPQRSIRLRQIGNSDSGFWCPETRVNSIRLHLGQWRWIDGNVLLDADKAVRLLALVLLGEDGIGHRQLLLQIVVERHFTPGPKLRLSIEPYAPKISIDVYDPVSYLPSSAGKLLDDLVAELKAIPGLATDTN